MECLYLLKTEDTSKKVKFNYANNWDVVFV